MTSSSPLIAFEYLRREAREAHLAGDGLRVNHLAAMALSRFRGLLELKSSEVTLDNIKWACIFPLFWLTHDYMANDVRQSREGAVKSHVVSDEFNRALKTYEFYIDQPLAGFDDHEKMLTGFGFEWCAKDDQIEDSILVTHLLEMVWWHSRGDSRWLTVADAWLTRCPEWLAQPIKRTRDRLVIQTRLTHPTVDFPRIDMNEVERISQEFLQARLWVYLLNRESKALDKEVAEWIRGGLAKDTNARVLFDVHHSNRFFGSYGEPQPIGLTRRWVQSMDSPVLVFNEVRDAAFDNILYRLYRDESVGNVVERFTAFRLAMSLQIAALRIWSIADWADAVRKEADACFEVCRWEKNQPDWAAQALLLRVRAASLPRANERLFVRRAIEQLEFAPIAVLDELVSSLLNTYTQQKKAAWDLLLDIGDLIPELLWSSVADWQLSYLNEVFAKKDFGIGLKTLELWGILLPHVSSDSPIWGKLRCEAHRQALIPWAWDDNLDFFESWMCYAPLPLALELGERFFESKPDEADSEDRNSILAVAELRRPELSGRYKRRLLEVAQNWKHKVQLSPLLTDEERRKIMADAKPQVIHSIEAMLGEALPPLEAKMRPMPMRYPWRIPDIDWKIEDLSTIEKIVSAINNKNVSVEYLRGLFATLHYLIDHGPVEFAEHIYPFSKGWLNVPPSGRISRLASDTGPLSDGIHKLVTLGTPDLDEEIGWIVCVITQRIGREAADVFELWMEKLRRKKPTKAFSHAVAIFFDPKMKLPEATAEKCASMVRDLISLTMSFSETRDSSALVEEMLKNIANSFGQLPNQEEIPSIWLPTIDCLTNLLPRLSRLPSPQVRVHSASLCNSLVPRSIEVETLQPVLTALSKDNRASVRRGARIG